MQIFLFLALILVVLAFVIILQNMAVVSLTLFLWPIQLPLGIVLLIALGAGLLIGLTLLLPGSVRNKFSLSSHKKKLAAAESERNIFQKKAEDFQKEITTLEEQLASFSAALEERQSGESQQKPEESQTNQQNEPPAS